MAKATKQETVTTIVLELSEEEAVALWRLTYSHNGQYLQDDGVGGDFRQVNGVYGALEKALGRGSPAGLGPVWA